jgi:hypothetical protein
MQVVPENIVLLACRCECVSRQQSHSKHAKPTQDHARPAGPRPSYPALDSLGPCRGERASVDGIRPFARCRAGRLQASCRCREPPGFDSESKGNPSRKRRLGVQPTSSPSCSPLSRISRSPRAVSSCRGSAAPSLRAGSRPAVCDAVAQRSDLPLRAACVFVVRQRLSQ